MSMRMKVILEVTSQEQIKAIMDVLDIKKDELIVKKTEEYKAPEMMPLLTEKSKEQRRKEDIAEIKAAYAEKRKRGRPKKELPPLDNNEIVRMVDEEGKTFSEIGRIFGVSYKTISNRYWTTKGADE